MSNFAFKRRLLSVTAVLIAAAFLLTLLPIWLPLATLVGLVRRARFILARLLVFLTVYAWAECAGLIGYSFLRLRFAGKPERAKGAVYRIQELWSQFLFGAARRLLALSLHVEGDEHLATGPIFLFPRHSSIADTLLPGVCVAAPHKYHLRYVLKKELLWDPCLDFVGNFLPNYFVDRGGDSKVERESVGRLGLEMSPNDGVVLYPEGTRFAEAKRVKILDSMRRTEHPFLAQASALTHVLPPRTGGAMALLDANPNIDVVFCAHTGMESFSNVKTLLSHAAIGVRVRLLFWRIQSHQIPRDENARQEWLFEQWKRMDQEVQRLLD